MDIIGWDIGGAHLKAVAITARGRVVAIRQEASPLWRGPGALETALDRIFDFLTPGAHCRHAVTMTGELADIYPDRSAGVRGLAGEMAKRCSADSLLLFAGDSGFVPAADLNSDLAMKIASANWLASGLCVAAYRPEALFIDVGSTTTDIFLIAKHKVCNRGYTDCERLRYDELLYSGVIRTPLMAICDRVPVKGEWTRIMAEQFASASDVYRLTGELDEHTDQLPAADGGDKTVDGSRRRLARMVGSDTGSGTGEQWLQLARYWREAQLGQIREGIEAQLSRGEIGSRAPLVGAGVGRFLVKELASRLARPYFDFSEMLGDQAVQTPFSIDDCAPAAAVAWLARRALDRR